MTIGLTIPGIETVHPRQSWQNPNQPVTGPSSTPSNWDLGVVHYSGTENVPDGDPWDISVQQWLRSVQNAYKNDPNRGYSIGYNFAVDWLGGVWECRGWDIRNAANRDHNLHTVSFIALVDGAEPVTPQAARSIRCLQAEARRLSGRGDGFAVRPSGHGQLRLDTGKGTATACPGLGVQAQIAAGEFDIRPPEDDMATKNVVLLRWDGYAEQLEASHVSRETKGYTGLEDAPVVVLPKPNAALQAKIEAELGHPLTPLS